MNFKERFLLVVDLDYTLINNSKGFAHIPKANIHEIKRLVENPKFHLSIATGRSVEQKLEAIVEKISIDKDIYGVLSNGANLTTWNSRYDESYQTVDTHEVEKAKEVLELVKEWSKKEPYVETVKNKIIKIYVEMKKGYRKYDDYKAFLDLAKKTGINIYNFGEAMDIVGSNSTKAKGVIEFMGMLGIPKEQVIVIGDSINDLSMMEEFENSFLVSNSSIIDIKPEHTVVLKSSNSGGCITEVMKKVGYKYK